MNTRPTTWRMGQDGEWQPVELSEAEMKEAEAIVRKLKDIHCLCGRWLLSTVPGSAARTRCSQCKRHIIYQDGAVSICPPHLLPARKDTPHARP